VGGEDGLGDPDDEDDVDEDVPHRGAGNDQSDVLAEEVLVRVGILKGVLHLLTTLQADQVIHIIITHQPISKQPSPLPSS
jgi:hypothetical protein